MPLSARQSSPLALYRKLEREAYRAFHAKAPAHKADHFFNFCVTAASMRDYAFEHLNLVTAAQKQPYYDAWCRIPALVAAAEVANSSKHFTLRSRSTGLPVTPKTKTVRFKRSAFVDVYANATGETKMVETRRTEVSITLANGKRLELHAFTDEVLKYWKIQLTSLGFKVRRQSFALLAGR